MNTKTLTIALLAGLIAGATPAVTSAAAPKAPATRPARAAPPARDPNTPGYVKAKELPDGEVPPPDADGNFIIGPTHKKAPEMTSADGVPRGEVRELTMKSTDSKIYPGIAREQGTFGTPDPANPAK